MINSRHSQPPGEHLKAHPAGPSPPDPEGTKRLVFFLSLTAGSADVISFLGLDGLFVAHITGNLVVLAARLAAGDQAPVAHLLSIPVFIVMIALVRGLVGMLLRFQLSTLVPLLLLHFVLCCAFLAGSLAIGANVGPDAATVMIAGMLGVSAMAVQNALVQISLPGVPSTAVMTTNLTRTVIDLSQVLLGRNTGEGQRAGKRARLSGLAIGGFLLGCIVGAAGEATFGMRSLVLPVSFAAMALAIAVRSNLKTA